MSSCTNFVFTITVKNFRALLGSKLLSIRVQTTKVTSDVTRALSQRKIKPIQLVLYPILGDPGVASREEGIFVGESLHQ